MNLIKKRKKLVIFGVVAYAAGIAYFAIVGGPNVAKRRNAALDDLAVALRVGTSGPAMLAVRTKISDCAIAGPLPDRACTPGTAFASATPAQVCAEGYSKTVRAVSVAIKKKVFKEYGVAYPQPFGSYEVDHLIPLEIGGANDIANLFPEPAEPSPGFHEKDLVEDYLHDEVCAGRLDIAEAQMEIAADWQRIYQVIPPAALDALRKKYRSWAAPKPAD
jgi:hypothetical protein